MTTENARRDRNMYEMFDEASFPRIRASLRNVDPELLRGGDGDQGRRTLPFDLTIRDVTQSLVGEVSNWREESDHATFDLDFDVSLAQFGLEAPTALLFIRVGDRVAVHVAVSVRRE